VSRIADAEACVERAIAPDTRDDEVEAEQCDAEPRPGRETVGREPQVEGEERKPASAEDPDDAFESAEAAATNANAWKT
jgi:hypothetical protein